MKKSTIEQKLAEIQAKLDELKKKPILTKKQTRDLIRKKRTEFTQLVKNKYHQNNDDIHSFAKNLKVSEAFAKHILYKDTVPVSERVIERISKRYNLSLNNLKKIAESRNEIAKKYQRMKRLA